LSIAFTQFCDYSQGTRHWLCDSPKYISFRITNSSNNLATWSNL